MSIIEPSKILTPWASSGSKNQIPANANNTTGAAGFDKGFPDITMTAEEAGGLPPAGQDFNGIFFQITDIIRYMQAGGKPTFSHTLSTAIGGYPKGSVVLGGDMITLWQSKIDSNSTDPSTDPSDWGIVDVDVREDISSSAGSSLVGYNRGTTNCSDITAERKFLTERHCSDWGIRCDGTDETAKMLAMAADINAIPNPNGNPVKLIFSGQTDAAAPILSFASTIKFTRPVYLDGCGETTIAYAGTGSTNAFEFGPPNLTGDSVSPTGFVVHKYYAVSNFIVAGGATSGVCFYFNNYIIYPKVMGCIFKYFGGDGSWAVRFQSNNWWAVVEHCSFDAHVLSHADDGVKRNFVSCPGVALDGTRDEFATRLLAQNNQLYASGWTMGGIGYLLSGWNSRIIGGSIEGMKTDIIVGAGCNDVEISTYSEKNYPEEASSFIQLSYVGDPYFAQYPWVKRLNVHDTYINLHNTDVNATPARFQSFAQNVKLQDFNIDEVTLVASAYEVLQYPEIPGHSGNRVTNIHLDGYLGENTLLIDQSYASLYPAGYDLTVSNYSKVSDFSDIVSAVVGAAPLAGNFGITGLLATSDGSGGAYNFTNGASNNTAAGGYERNRIGGQKFFGALRCTSAPSGQTYLTLIFELDATENELLNNDVCISFWAKANGSPVTVGGVHYMAGSGTQTSGQNLQTIAVGNWARYAIQIKVPSAPLGAPDGAIKQSVSLTLPINQTFDVNIAGVLVSKGTVSPPFSCAS